MIQLLNAAGISRTGLPCGDCPNFGQFILAPRAAYESGKNSYSVVGIYVYDIGTITEFAAILGPDF